MPGHKTLPRGAENQVRDLAAAAERGKTQSLPQLAVSAEAFAPAQPGRLHLSLVAGLAAGGVLGPRGRRRFVLPAPPLQQLPERPARRPSESCCQFREDAIIAI